MSLLDRILARLSANANKSSGDDDKSRRAQKEDRAFVEANLRFAVNELVASEPQLEEIVEWMGSIVTLTTDSAWQSLTQRVRDDLEAQLVARAESHIGTLTTEYERVERDNRIAAALLKATLSHTSPEIQQMRAENAALEVKIQCVRRDIEKLESKTKLTNRNTGMLRVLCEQRGIDPDFDQPANPQPSVATTRRTGPNNAILTRPQ